MFSRLTFAATVCSIAALAQDAAPAKDPAQEPQKDVKAFLVEPGTHIPLSPD